MVDPKYLCGFFNLSLKEAEELEEKVKAELEVEDPSAEKARAILQKGEAGGPEDS